jgi:phosphopantothenoylcysteine decarboxylase/phosphopantothenate--cysteine ligase
MNVNMYENSIVQANIEKLEQLGYSFVGPKVGTLATGITGKGPLAAVDEIVSRVEELLGASG